MVTTSDQKKHCIGTYRTLSLVSGDACVEGEGDVWRVRGDVWRVRGDVWRVRVMCGG